MVGWAEVRGELLRASCLPDGRADPGPVSAGWVRWAWSYIMWKASPWVSAISLNIHIRDFYKDIWMIYFKSSEKVFPASRNEWNNIEERFLRH